VQFMVSFDIMKRSVHVRRSVQGERSYPSKLPDDFLESIELFKLAYVDRNSRKIAERWDMRQARHRLPIESVI